MNNIIRRKPNPPVAFVRRRVRSGSLAFIFLALMSVAACEETFDTPQKALLGVRLAYSLSTDTETPTITAQGVNNDSILLNGITAGSFLLQLTSGEITAYAIRFDTISNADTVTFFHEATLAYESMASGFFFEYILKDTVAYTSIRIDSIIINSNSVTQTRNTEHVTIYLNSPPVINDNGNGDDDTDG